MAGASRENAWEHSREVTTATMPLACGDDRDKGGCYTSFMTHSVRQWLCGCGPSTSAAQTSEAFMQYESRAELKFSLSVALAVQESWASCAAGDSLGGFRSREGANDRGICGDTVEMEISHMKNGRQIGQGTRKE